MEIIFLQRIMCSYARVCFSLFPFASCAPFTLLRETGEYYDSYTHKINAPLAFLTARSEACHCAPDFGSTQMLTRQWRSRKGRNEQLFHVQSIRIVHLLISTVFFAPFAFGNESIDVFVRSKCGIRNKNKKHGSDNWSCLTKFKRSRCCVANGPRSRSW